MMPGPCCICGATNYEASMGGPTICPSCDCGNFGVEKVTRQRREIERLLVLLGRCLKIAESGRWRDGTHLSLNAHPVWDDVRETLRARTQQLTQPQPTPET